MGHINTDVSIYLARNNQEGEMKREGNYFVTKVIQALHIHL